MKRLLPAIPVLFVILLNACSGNGGASVVPPDMSTAVIQTLTAMVWTPPPTSTHNPQIPNMISTLNVDLLVTNPLEGLLDAKYYVQDISIDHVEGYPDRVFLVSVHCECIHGDDCCHPGRTFVVIMNAMKRNYISILAHVPPSVSYLMVMCAENKRQIGGISVPWTAVSEYLQTRMTDYQFEDQVRLIESP